MVPKVTKFIEIIHRKDIEINRGIIGRCNEEMDYFLEHLWCCLAVPTSAKQMPDRADNSWVQC